MIAAQSHWKRPCRDESGRKALKTMGLPRWQNVYLFTCWPILQIRARIDYLKPNYNPQKVVLQGPRDWNFARRALKTGSAAGQP